MLASLSNQWAQSVFAENMKRRGLLSTGIVAKSTESVLPLLRATDGLDMVSKTVQYSSLFLSWFFAYNFGIQKSMLALYRNISSARQWMRLGRLIPEFIALENIISHGAPKSPKKALEFARVLCNISYFVCDHLSWLIESGVIVFLDLQFWGDTSSWAWLSGLLICIIFDIFALGDSSGDSLTDVYWDLLRHFADLMVALTATGMASFNEGILGICGATAGVATLIKIWPKFSKSSGSGVFKSD